MNVVEHRSLWSAIQQFPLDEPEAAINFSKKLAAEQNWSPAFTQRAIEEYRKFVFLCCIAPKGASPSKTVDEVWHLHLTYTRSYWIKFCKETLGKDIHHNPSRGGEDEDHKHEHWYRETLQLYQQVFESPPPKDIWPPPVDESPPRIQFVPDKTYSFLTALLLSIPLVVIGLLYFNYNPFSLTGPQFLIFFPILSVCCIGCYCIRQVEKSAAIRDLVDRHFPSNATIFELAHFLYGKHRAIQTAIVDLVRRRLLEVTEYKQFLVHKQHLTLENEKNPFVQHLIGEKENIVNYDMIAGNWYVAEQFKHPSLEFLYSCAYQKLSLLARFHYLIIPFVIALVRFCQGIANGKPVLYLVAEIFGLIVISIFVEGSYSQKMIYVKRTMQLAQRRHEVRALYPEYVVADFGMQGNTAIEFYGDGLLLAGIFAAYPVLDHKRAYASDSGSSCSSCSGGGGGCGGGGCGGCGGGD